MSLPKTCSRCGSELPLDGPVNLCFSCLGRLILSPSQPQVDAEPVAVSLREAAAKGLAPEGESPRFGDYLLLKEIARGGMGIVYQARQLSLDRLVALKTIRPECLADEQAVRRFHKEAQAAAKLRHPNIVAVHEVGEHQGQHFYSMDFVPGQNLAQIVRHYPLAARQAADYLKTIAEATHYAHEQGVLHRDLKPSNVLIDDQDQPHITDFGLAKLMQEGSELTLTGIVMGSPSYLAPEQAQGRNSAVGVRSDVYSLGAIFYELITGRPPFKGESASATLKLVADSEPIAPRQMNPKVPRDLETICLKCLEKEPARRYASARTLAEDLGRYLRGEPIWAKPVGIAGKTWRWCRRKPALAGTIALSAMMFVLGFLGVTWQWRRAEGERQMQRLRAYAADMRAADAAIQEADLGQATELLERYLPPTTAETDVRGIEWRYLWQLSRSDDVGGWQYPTIPFSGSLSPDNRWLVVSGIDGWVRVHDRQGKEILRQATGFTKRALPEPTVAFAPQGDRLAAATATNILIWDTRSWRLEHRLPCRKAALAFSPDGQWLAAMGELGLQVWSTTHWQLEARPGECPVPRSYFHQVVFGPDSSRIALANRDYPVVAIWNLATHAMISTNFSIPNALSLAISPDGRWMAAGTVSGLVKVGSLASPEGCVALPPRTTWVMGLAFSPDSQVLATGGADQQIHLWQAGTTNHLRSFKGHRGEIWWLRFSADGQWLVSGSSDGTVRRWSLSTPSIRQHRFELPPDCRLLDLTDRGTRAQVLNCADYAFEVWDWMNTNRLSRIQLRGKADDFQAIKTARLDGIYLICGNSAAIRLAVYDTRTGERVFPLPNQSNRFLPACVSSDHRRVAGAEFIDGQWQGGVWDLRTGQRLVSLPDQIPDTSARGNAAFSPDGRLLAYESVGHRITVLQLANSRTLRLPGHRRPLYPLRFSPDGRRLASGSWDSTARVWDAVTGQPITPWLRTRVSSLHFSPDGQTLVSTDEINLRFRFWHVPTGTEMLGKLSKTSPLERAFDSEGTVFMEGVLPSLWTLQLTRLPALAEIDAQLRTGGLVKLSPLDQ